ncbi:helix-turn-helix domain-containing protein [Listeria weihenstephanensis]|uniref:Helix-turn-helix domain-containing protein n=1 Tax=Listeria weihenstephanensis TaxID=1006155 RepID=A0A841Z5N2_9LIST|nr:Rgg/GadR/MutR family transcriptional regulator [Listeria weihenstephanensis]MBC1499693.1 helix-turn-helix domain-containing protein [Listeria weihenstephanensis]
MNFGETIKKIRKDKNFTQKELSEGILTRSHLSQIETNNYYPSYDKFFLLLNRLNIVFEEFLFVQNDQKMLFNQHIRSQIGEAANMDDTEKLKDLAITAKDLYEKTENITYYHYMLICNALISYSISHVVNDDMIQFVTPIKEYLFGMDNWYLYELKLFNNIIYALTVDEALLFSRTSLRRLANFQYFLEFQHIEQNIYTNLSTLCLEHKNFKAAKNFAETAIEKAKKYMLVYEKVCSELNHAIARIKLGEDGNAYEVIEKNMLILKYLEFDSLHEHFSGFLKKFEIEVDI